MKKQRRKEQRRKGRSWEEALYYIDYQAIQFDLTRNKKHERLQKRIHERPYQKEYVR